MRMNKDSMTMWAFSQFIDNWDMMKLTPRIE